MRWRRSAHGRLLQSYPLSPPTLMSAGPNQRRTLLHVLTDTCIFEAVEASNEVDDVSVFSNSRGYLHEWCDLTGKSLFFLASTGFEVPVICNKVTVCASHRKCTRIGWIDVELFTSGCGRGACRLRTSTMSRTRLVIGDRDLPMQVCSQVVVIFSVACHISSRPCLLPYTYMLKS